MDTARFLHLRSLFDRAMKLKPDKQELFLERECAGDQELLAEAMALRQAHIAAASRADAPDESADETPGADELPTATMDPGEYRRGEDRVIGPYRIRKEIGQGGMGTVYLAIRDDGTFRKSVALKILRKDQASDRLVERFQQERQVLANLDHGNIARILDGGQTSDGLPYYVMEFVDGSPLDQFCDSRKLDLAARVEVFLQICAAVQYLHDNLVVHRDLKPSNILVTGDGFVKLLDFGIAKQQVSAANIELTAVQGRIMTPGFASPEQFSGSPVSKASDIYSMGVILYLLLTGSLPHSTPEATLTTEPAVPSSRIREDIQRTPETTSELRSQIVGDLDQVVLMCLRRDPQNRYASARALGEDLQRFLNGLPVAARKGPVTERLVRFLKRNRLVVAVTALIVFLGVFGTTQALQARQAREALAKTAQVARLLDVIEKRETSDLSDAVRLEDVRKLHEAMSRELDSGVRDLTPQRESVLQRGVKYLERAKAFVSGDRALANEVAATWKQMGTIYQPANPQMASIAFNNAEAVREAASGAPDTSAQAPEASTAALGAVTTVPQIRSAPVAAHSLAAGRADQPAQAARTVDGPANGVAYKEFKTHLTAVVAKSMAAETSIAEIRRNAREQGQVVHPTIETQFAQMKLALDAAQKAADGGDYQDANENLGIADATAERVLKAGGGH